MRCCSMAAIPSQSPFQASKASDGRPRSSSRELRAKPYDGVGAGLDHVDVVTVGTEQPSEAIDELATGTEPAHHRRVVLHADLSSSDRADGASIGRTEHRAQLGQDAADVRGRIVALDLHEPHRIPRGTRQVDRLVGRPLARTEADTVLGSERVILFDVVALETGLTVGGLHRAHEPEAIVAERHTVVAVPAVQHRPAHLGRDAAHRGAVEDPPRWHVPHP